MVEGVVRPLGGDEAVARDYEECFVLLEGGRGVHSRTGGWVGGVGAADGEFGVEVPAGPFGVWGRRSRGRGR